jgi:hypothetical protein
MSTVRYTEEKMHVERVSHNYKVAAHLSNGRAYFAALSYIGALSDPKRITFRNVAEMREAGRLLLDAVDEIESAIAVASAQTGEEK